MNIEQTIKQCQVMAEPIDMIIESIILDHVTKQNSVNVNVMEIGSGSGGWPRILDKLGVKTVDWILLEDFSWVKNGYSASQYYWPYNKEDFVNFMTDTASSVFIKEMIDTDLSTAIQSDRLSVYSNNVNAMRIDCDISIEDTIYLIDNCLTENGIIILDDCRINCGITRILLMMKILGKKAAYPVWMGSKESALCKSYEYSLELQKQITETIDTQYTNSNISYNKEYIHTEDWQLVTTNNFKVFVNK